MTFFIILWKRLKNSLIFLDGNSLTDCSTKTNGDFFTVKLSSNLFVGKLGLTLRTCDGSTLGTALDDDELAID